jgi:RNase H-fold protein (predicted Holliday junction resolvase)
MTEIPSPSLLKGRRLALDFGLSRIGVAVSDPDGQFAFPTSVLDAQAWESDLSKILEEYEPVIIYIGYPVNLSGGRVHACDSDPTRRRATYDKERAQRDACQRKE